MASNFTQYHCNGKINFVINLSWC